MLERHPSTRSHPIPFLHHPRAIPFAGGFLRAKLDAKGGIEKKIESVGIWIERYRYCSNAARISHRFRPLTSGTKGILAGAR